MTTSSLSPVIRTAEDYGQRDAADDLARRVTVARGATFGLHRLSLMQLAVRLEAAEMARLGVAPATALGRRRSPRV
jgi:hypothetical protein